ncbi:uncharacterized protein HMPREF1541_06417 [Cyphellophora europaea CBS 101466]|uniref:JmjC domain-containing protein n=1 Tax=Cyphellophora europaea (strain CBS 101466) TaxID=1220924 RepID=W2RPK6_CYPE1|nr:uncharacterized protein HMPREF1541_06417 [Cyphellophora europaea CBS 101466]ETN38382.1 hypothetical protein HMPREF1541_06417 [Cyphellophora europaea CBS 101466]
MIPPTPSLTVPPEASAEHLLRLGKPFVQFPRYSIVDLQTEQDHEGNPIPFSQWLQTRLQSGKPFVLADFDKLGSWPKGNPRDGSEPGFGIERLIELSTKKNIPIRNCSTGRDLSFTLRKFADSAQQSLQEFQNLYARDLPCPPEWLQQCEEVLPTELQWSGKLDLFQWLPPCARSEVMMAYVGSEGSSSGFHRCFSSTVALNLLVESDDRPIVCIGTDFDSQKKYDSFISARGVSPHLDWYNLNTDEMLKADFPLYVYDQRVGDLVVFPPATAHQVWNPSTLCTKMVWNILHPLSLEVGFQNVQPSFNRLCHPDLARTNLSLACAMMSLLQDDPSMHQSVPLPPDLPLLSRLFRQMVHDEQIDSPLATPISLVSLPPTVIATCNFCSTAIWNRHVRCTQCTDFDLCLLCYLNGRSCEHTNAYAWAEIVPSDQCTRILTRAREILGFQPETHIIADDRKTLGTAVNDLMRAKQSQTSRLCHLCRIDHPEWKGRRCDKCTAFFCYRGLFRHFDMSPGDVLRHSESWMCPKCKEVCNCRCCHFNTAYIKSEKPASKRRVRAADPRGKTVGFADNVFDQKRGRRESHASDSGSLPGVSQLAGRKRPLAASASALGNPATPMRKLELPTPEPDFSNYSHHKYSDSFTSSGPILPGVKSIAEGAMMMSPGDDRSTRVSTSPGLGSLASTMGITPDRANTLPPIMSRGLSQQGYAASMNGSNGMPLPGPSPKPSTLALLNESIHADTKSPTAVLDASIRELEGQIANLRKYEQEFIDLGLEDSRKMLSAQVHELEEKIRQKKREKGVILIERLRREGFGGLAAVVGKEVGVEGLGAGIPGLG